jgi:hypothetical protein
VGRHIKEEELGNVHQGLVQLEVHEDVVGNVDRIIGVQLACQELHGVIRRVRPDEDQEEFHLCIVEPCRKRW